MNLINLEKIYKIIVVGFSNKWIIVNHANEEIDLGKEYYSSYAEALDTLTKWYENRPIPKKDLNAYITATENLLNSVYGINLFLKKIKEDKNGITQFLTVNALRRLYRIKLDEPLCNALGIVRYSKIIETIAQIGAIKFSVSKQEIIDSINNSYYFNLYKKREI